MDRRGVSQIVQPWLSSRSTLARYLRDLAQSAKPSLDRELFDAFAVAHPKERTLDARRPMSIRALTIIYQDSSQVLTQWDQPHFIEFGLPNDEDRLTQIDVGDVESDRLPQAQSRAIQKQQQRTQRILAEKRRRALTGSGRGPKQSRQFLVGVDVGNEYGRVRFWSPRQGRQVYTVSGGKISTESVQGTVPFGDSLGGHAPVVKIRANLIRCKRRGRAARDTFAKRAQHELFALHATTQSAPISNVVRDQFRECHRSLPKLSSATSRNPFRSTFAYTDVLAARR